MNSIRTSEEERLPFHATVGYPLSAGPGDGDKGSHAVSGETY